MKNAIRIVGAAPQQKHVTLVLNNLIDQEINVYVIQDIMIKMENAKNANFHVKNVQLLKFVLVVKNFRTEKDQSVHAYRDSLKFNKNVNNAHKNVQPVKMKEQIAYFVI